MWFVGRAEVLRVGASALPLADLVWWGMWLIGRAEVLCVGASALPLADCDGSGVGVL